MGTRHYQKVITKSGDIKIRQYGQWDGYPSGQGIDILTYLRNGNLVKYQENLENIRPIRHGETEIVNKDKAWSTNYPYLSRDCGSDIHQMIENNTVKFVGLTNEEDANNWCEGFYTIDFNQNVFISQYSDKVQVFPLDKLPTDEEYLEVMEPKKVQVFPLDKLPTDE